jgi:hypothetical protein
MATRRRAPARKGRIASVDFTGVEAGGGGRLLPEDTHEFELVEIEEETGENSGEPYLAAVFKVTDGEYEGTKAYDNFSLQPQALWKLRSFLEAAGYTTEDGPMDIPYDDMIGLVASADVIHEDYKGKKKHRINSWLIEGEPKETEKEERSARGGTRGGAVRRKSNGADDEPTFKLKDEVTFKDGKKTLTGTIISIDGEDVSVKVGRDEYDMKVEDITAA